MMEKWVLGKLDIGVMSKFFNVHFRGFGQQPIKMLHIGTVAE
jgi:hypothetical protein